jgi:hypothetical protein
MIVPSCNASTVTIKRRQAARAGVEGWGGILVFARALLLAREALKVRIQQARSFKQLQAACKQTAGLSPEMEGIVVQQHSLSIPFVTTMSARPCITKKKKRSMQAPVRRVRRTTHCYTKLPRYTVAVC